MKKKFGAHCRIFSTTTCNGILCFSLKWVHGEVRTKTAPSAVNKMGMDHSCKGFPMPSYHQISSFKVMRNHRRMARSRRRFLGKKSGDGSRYCSFFLYCLQWESAGLQCCIFGQVGDPSDSFGGVKKKGQFQTTKLPTKNHDRHLGHRLC